MVQLLIYAMISGSALLIGCLFGVYTKISKKLLSTIMAFGSGVLLSAMSIDLMSEAFDKSPKTSYLLVSFLMGALLFVIGDGLIDKLGGHKRRGSISHEKQTSSNSGMAILLGTILDGIPESIVMGISLANAKENAGGFIFVLAVFLSNFPEGISGTIAMLKSGIPKIKIIAIWSLMLVMTVLFSYIGYTYLGDAKNGLQTFFLAFASGAILAMLCDSLLPEALELGGRWTGFSVSCGFIISFLLSKLF